MRRELELVLAGGALALSALYLSQRARRSKVLWRRVLQRRRHIFEQEDEQGDEQEDFRPGSAKVAKGAQKLQSHVGFNKVLIAERAEVSQYLGISVSE